MIALSVIIPAFHPRDFEALTRSMADNADVDAEWIVVDDASGPDYDAVFATLPEGVQLIRQPENRRQGAARNAGLAHAGGRGSSFSMRMTNWTPAIWPRCSPQRNKVRTRHCPLRPRNTSLPMARPM